MLTPPSNSCFEVFGNSQHHEFDTWLTRIPSLNWLCLLCTWHLYQINCQWFFSVFHICLRRDSPCFQTRENGGSRCAKHLCLGTQRSVADESHDLSIHLSFFSPLSQALLLGSKLQLMRTSHDLGQLVVCWRHLMKQGVLAFIWMRGYVCVCVCLQLLSHPLVEIVSSRQRHEVQSYTMWSPLVISHM